MLLVETPHEFERYLPGFVPRSLLTPDQAGAGGSTEAFDAALWKALSGSNEPAATTSLNQPFTGGDFWSSFHLVSRAAESQYDVLRRVIAARRELPGHVVCLALAGDAFHGQHGRHWEAGPGNLHLSIGLRCDLEAGDIGLALTMLPAVAVMDALTQWDDSLRGSSDLGIKWVNDILAGGCKLGGVLSSVRSQEGRITSAVLGIGLNVALAPEVAPTPFTPGVTSLSDHLLLPRDGLTQVLTRLLTALADRFGELERRGSGPLLSAYRSFSLVMGRECEIRPDQPSDGPVRRGRVTAIGSDLALSLSDGPEPVSSGRLIIQDQEDQKDPAPHDRSL